MDFKLPERFENSNKSTYGKVLNIAGSDYMPGAAYLSSVSALKVGCGYCFLCSTERAIDAVAAQTQNIVFLPQNKAPDFIKNSHPDVVSVGCGLSQDDGAITLFNNILNSLPSNTPLVIDADGLNILSKDYSNYLSKNFKNVLLTPHPMEAARLLNCSLEDVLANVEKSAFDISQKYNCTIALKTHKTIVVSPKGQKYINNTGNNSMAKAGSGDVLTGIIAGLAAQGLSIYDAAILGVYMHGLCGDFATERLTKYSVMADDLISTIPNVINSILNS